MNNEIKSGDFVRLTDPISNGEVVRVEKVDEHGYMDFIGGSQHITTAKQIMISPYLNTNSNTISETCHEITRNTGVKLYPESAVQYWQHRAEKAEEENALNEKLLDKEHNKLLDAQDKLCAKEEENKELRQRILLLEAELREVD